jgi:hypothetical protein
MTRDDMQFDVRSLRHRLRRTELTTKDVQKHLDALPDDAAEADQTKTEFVSRWDGKSTS